MQKAYALFLGAPIRIGWAAPRCPPAILHLNPPRAAYFFALFFSRSCASFSAIFISSPLLTGL